MLPAFALTGDSMGSDWNRASRSEKAKWVVRAVDAVNTRSAHKYNYVEINACIDSFYIPPIPKGVATMTLGEAAAGCMTMLKK